MSSHNSANPVPTADTRASDGRFAKGNPGGPGNPFARKTSALCAALLNRVTERDIQDILDVLLLKAKGGHLPTIKFLFSYVIGKPQPAVNPDVLDLQELQLLQQGTLLPESLEALCRQLPINFLLHLVNYSQTLNQEDAIKEVQPDAPTKKEASLPSAYSPPSVNGDNGSTRVVVTERVPSANGDIRGPESAQRAKHSSQNGDNRHRSKLHGFDWLRDLRRLLP